MFYASDGSCGGYRYGVWTAPSRCPAPIVAAGLVFYERPRPSVWWAFACPDHAEHLTAARTLLGRDRAEITRRRTPGERTEALAVGRAAHELVKRARRWACAHPELAYIRAAAPPTPPSTDQGPRGTAAHPFAAYARDAQDQRGSGTAT